MALLRINPRPAPRQLLVFALGWLVFVGVIGWVQWIGGRPRAALVCGILAAGVPVIGAVWREGLRRLYVGLTYATFPIGFVISSVVLAAIYYAVLTPIGLILRVCRYDPMQRLAAKPKQSYWHRRSGPREAADYFRQH